jgi:hypothetical protein
MDNEDCLNHKIRAIGFARLESPNDGNCFFYSLETYFKMKETCLAEKDHMELRGDLVAYLLAHSEKFRPFVVREYKVKSEVQRLRYLDAYIRSEIKKIGKSNIYDTDLGDIMPQEATNAFKIRIVIHNWRWTTLDFAQIDLKPDDGEYKHTIHLLRMNENHFDLLYPIQEFDRDAQDRWEMIKLMREGFESYSE